MYRTYISVDYQLVLNKKLCRISFKMVVFGSEINIATDDPDFDDMETHHKRAISVGVDSTFHESPSGTEDSRIFHST